MAKAEALKPSLSIALVTRNRPESLERALRSWRAQEEQPYEIVVSDDSDPGWQQKVRRVVEDYGATYLQGPRRGLYANRNHASLACSGSHVMSADDDHTHPAGFTQTVLSIVATDPSRIWTFGEKDINHPSRPMAAPTEMHVSGAGCSPPGNDWTAAIADGATVYPREVFESGLRYDETYRFGGVWYLWGKLLQRLGWRITYSGTTYVWHHFTKLERHSDPAFLEHQLCCNTYCSLVNSAHINPSFSSFGLGLLYLARRTICQDAILCYDVRTRISLRNGARVLMNVWRARAVYQRFLVEGKRSIPIEEKEAAWVRSEG